MPFHTVAALVQPKPEAQHVMVHAEHGFTAILPLADLDREVDVSVQAPGGTGRSEGAAVLDGKEPTMAESDAVPEYVIRTLALIRESGLANMPDYRVITMLAEQMGDPRAASWLNAFGYRYGEALQAMGTRLAETRDKW